MLTAWCETRGAQVLIPTDRVLGITNTDAGVRVVYRCWCEEVCVWETGQPHAHPLVAVEGAAAEACC